MTDEAPRKTGAVAAETAGRALGGLFRIMKIARPVRPIHPNGVALHGELLRTGSPAEPSGIEWLDSVGTDAVQARVSRSAGLPEKLPDVLGLALRLTPSQQSAGNGHVGQDSSTSGCADILFSSTGWRVPGRFLLMLKRNAAAAALTTIMPYQGQRGPVLLGLRTISLPPASLAGGTLSAGPLVDADWVLELHWAKPAGTWRPCGELRLRATQDLPDTPLRFNPLENQPPGARTYPWARRLRERSYRIAQQPAPPT